MWDGLTKKKQKKCLLTQQIGLVPVEEVQWKPQGSSFYQSIVFHRNKVKKWTPQCSPIFLWQTLIWHPTLLSKLGFSAISNYNHTSHQSLEYRRVASSNMSCLETHPGLCTVTFWQKNIFEFVTCISTCDFTVNALILGFFKTFGRDVLRPLRSKDVQGWILRLPQHFLQTIKRMLPTSEILPQRSSFIAMQ